MSVEAVHPAQVARWTAEERRANAAAAKDEFELSNYEREREIEDASGERQRVYHFNAEVNRGSVSECITELDLWSRRDRGQRIDLFFQSPGGNVMQGLALYDFMRELRRRGHEVYTHAYGMVASMGGILLQGGSARVMADQAWLMIHEPKRTAFFDEMIASGLKDEAEFYDLMWQQLRDILAERASISADDIATPERAARRDWWMLAPEAKKLGFCDLLASEL